MKATRLRAGSSSCSKSRRFGGCVAACGAISEGNASDIGTWTRHTLDQTRDNRTASNKSDRYCARDLPSRIRCRPKGHDQVNRQTHQLVDELRHTPGLTLGRAPLNPDVLAVDPAVFGERLVEGIPVLTGEAR